MTILMYFNLQCNGCDKLFETSSLLHSNTGDLLEQAGADGWAIGPKGFGSIVVDEENDFCPKCKDKNKG